MRARQKTSWNATLKNIYAEWSHQPCRGIIFAAFGGGGGGSAPLNTPLIMEKISTLRRFVTKGRLSASRGEN